MITRRIMLTGIAAGTCVAAVRAPASASTPRGVDAARISAELMKIEAASGGRLGVAILDSETGFQIDHRGSERFPMCSTFKLLAASAILNRVDSGQDSLTRRVRFEAKDLVSYSPITKHHLGAPGMTLAELCQAALNYSDNTAGNMLLKQLGGPPGLTRYARSLGDNVTRLDRWETALNEAVPGDPRDTTTPVAMRGNIQKLVLGKALSPTSSETLGHWLLGCKTSDARLKARLPAGWRVGDKTGSGDHGSTNDVGVIWRPNKKPIAVTVYLTNTDADQSARNATIASVGQIIAETLV